MGAEGEEVFRLAVETGLALLHSLWQGALVAFALGWVLKRMPARRAVLRHNLGCAALVLMLALLVATWTRMEGTPPEGIYALRDGAARLLAGFVAALALCLAVYAGVAMLKRQAASEAIRKIERKDHEAGVHASDARDRLRDCFERGGLPDARTGKCDR